MLVPDRTILHWTSSTRLIGVLETEEVRRARESKGRIEVNMFACLVEDWEDLKAKKIKEDKKDLMMGIGKFFEDEGLLYLLPRVLCRISDPATSTSRQPSPLLLRNSGRV